MNESQIEKLVSWMQKYCDRVEVTGAIRRKQPSDVVRLLVIPKFSAEADTNQLFGSREVNLLEQAIAKYRAADSPEGYVQYKIPTGMFEVIYTSEACWVSSLVKTTGPQTFLIEIYTMLKGTARSWKGCGLLGTNGERYMPKDERDFLSWIGIPWTEPEMRFYGPFWPKDAPDNLAPITQVELRNWKDNSRWVKSACGGEPHEYTVRAGLKDDEMFCRVANTIYELGYDGSYLKRSWRYLDLDGYRYFAVDYRIAETTLINRKPYFTADHQVRPWFKNPKTLHLMSQADPDRERKHAASIL